MMLFYFLVELSVALDCFACFANVAQGQNCTVQVSSVITCPDEMVCYYETINSTVETWDRESVVAWRGCRIEQNRNELCENKIGVVQGNIIRTESCVWTCQNDLCNAEFELQSFSTPSTSTEATNITASKKLSLDRNMQQNNSSKTILSAFLSIFVLLSTISFAYILYFKYFRFNQQTSPL